MTITYTGCNRCFCSDMKTGQVGILRGRPETFGDVVVCLRGYVLVNLTKVTVNGCLSSEPVEILPVGASINITV